MADGYLFADFGAWLSEHDLTMSHARKDGCRGIAAAAEAGFLPVSQAEQWAEAVCADVTEIWPDGPKPVEELKELVAAVAYLEDEIVNAEQVDKELAGEESVPQLSEALDALLEPDDPPQIIPELAEAAREAAEDPVFVRQPIAIEKPPQPQPIAIQHGGVVTPEVVVAATALVFGVTSEQIVGRSAKRPIAQARHVAVAACRELTDYSWTLLGEFFGGRDHSTLMAGVRRLDADGKAMLERVIEYVENALPVLDGGQVADSVPLAVRLPGQLYSDLVGAADERGLTPDRIVAEALRDFLPRMVPVGEWRLTR